MQGFLTALAIVAAPRSLSIDGYEIGSVGPAFGDPGRKAGCKQVWIDPIHDSPQPISAWNAVVELGEAPQERQMCITPINDVVIIVAARDRPAHHQEQHLA